MFILGSLHSSACFPLPFTGALLILSVSTHLLFQISHITVHFLSLRRRSVSLSSFLPRTNTETSLCVSPWLDFSFCVITRLPFCVLCYTLQLLASSPFPPLRLGVTVSSSARPRNSIHFFCGRGWTETSQLPGPNPRPTSFRRRLRQERR